MGCRRYKGERYFDDLTEETHLPEELEEMPFVFDGQALVIDLSDDNAAAFRAAMAPFVDAARPTSKAKVLGTLPKRERHLKVVPPLPAEEKENEPEEEQPEGPSPHKGESTDALSEPDGLLVPESPAKPLDSVPPVEPSFEGREGDPSKAVSDLRSLTARPALSLAPPVPTEPIPAPWAEFTPARGDDKQSRVFKTRKWATEMGTPLNETLTPKQFAAWEAWYRDERWRNLQ